ncbi:hypothetical protein NGRA_2462 [Nosema granulosis]|uniref:Uncharacterized protein n=1 Tax=Nosema granulosis TaxID=83296 RepID=A0A9P6GZT9_9MICR|nr:hypothetical protein NGRA_2462 [Nosema granulosis]
MCEKFGNKTSIRAFLRSFQRKDESCRTYFERMRDIGEELFEDDELISEVAYLGLRQYKESIEEHALSYRAIDEDFLKTVSRVEEIKREAKERKIFKKMKEEGIRKEFHNKRQVNEIEVANDLLKENSIYMSGLRFKCILDTGSPYNFVTQRVVSKLPVKIFKMQKPLKLFTCLLTEFMIEYYTKI